MDAFTVTLTRGKMTYEYECSECKHIWEAEQSIKDEPLKTCPKCGKDSAKRLIAGNGGFILESGGVGWLVTDIANKWIH